MEMPLGQFSEVRNEFNMAASYFETGGRIYLNCFNARLTPGLGDDISAVKAFIDWISPKVAFIENSESVENSPTVRDWDKRIRYIDHLNGQIKNVGRDRTQKELFLTSQIKNELTRLFRDVSYKAQRLRMFDVIREQLGKSYAKSQYVKVQQENE